jgi:hypothetical protein
MDSRFFSAFAWFLTFLMAAFASLSTVLYFTGFWAWSIEALKD